MNRLCEMLGIRYPVIQAPMNWATDAEFVASVSNAGGLGVLGPNAGAKDPVDNIDIVTQRLRQQVRKVKKMTKLPFAVNLPIGQGAAREISNRCLDVGVEEKIPAAVVSMGSPDVYTSRLKERGIKVIHSVASVKHAVKAEQAGVDAIVCQGFEAGGHGGLEELSNLVLLPELVRSVKIPVIAAGGIVDVRGFLAALVLGAEGVCMGTRFLATTESPVHERVKKSIVDAGESSTAVWGRGWDLSRGLKNNFSQEVIRREKEGCSPADLKGYIQSYKGYGGRINRRIGGLLYGDVEEGEIYLGQGSILIDQVCSIEEVFKLLLEGASEILSDCSRKVKEM